MRVRQLFENVLVELNKRKAPSLILEDFNYFINKAIQQYINSRYNIYETTQQSIDDLGVIRATSILTPVINTNSDFLASNLLNKVYEVNLPDDYLHILNCVVEYSVLSANKCYKVGDKVQFGAVRLLSNSFPQLITNYYIKPAFDNPYFFINNINTSNVFPTDDDKVLIDFEDSEKVKTYRYGNVSKVKMEIRYGKDDTKFQLSKVYIDYLKNPQLVYLTQDDIDEVEDTSQMLEFPEYVVQEIINTLVRLLLENTSDPRLQGNNAINQTIGIPNNR